MRILIAINKDEGKESKLSAHFGHCENFAIYETETQKLEIVKNKISHSNPSSTPVDQLKIYSPDMVFSLGMGKKAIDLFKKENIELKIGEYKTVSEVIDNILKLDELNTGCGHDHDDSC